MIKSIESIKAYNLESSKGNKVANQIVIDVTIEQQYTKRIFQSYDSTICIATKKFGAETTVLDESKWDYSRTTMKYLGIFLRLTPKEIREKIKAGEYKLSQLN